MNYWYNNIDKCQNKYAEWKKPDQKNPNCMIPFIQNARNNKVIFSDRKQIMVLWGPEGKREKEGITKGHWEGEVAGDGYVHCLDFVDGFMVEYIYKMHKILHFKYVQFIICQLYLTTRLSTKNFITAIFLTWQL